MTRNNETVWFPNWKGETTQVNVVLTDEGSPIEIRSPRYGDKRTVKVGREWEVSLEETGEVIGYIVYIMMTRERRGKGLRYVLARWQSPGWGTRTTRFGRTFEVPSKTRGVERLVRDYGRV